MNPQHQLVTQTIVRLATLAAGADDERERVQIRHVAEALSESGITGFARFSREGLLNRASLDAVAAALSEPENQQLAYEKAVRVSAADGRMANLERPFVDDLAQALILDTQPVVRPSVADFDA